MCLNFEEEYWDGKHIISWNPNTIILDDSSHFKVSAAYGYQQLGNGRYINKDKGGQIVPTDPLSVFNCEQERDDLGAMEMVCNLILGGKESV